MEVNYRWKKHYKTAKYPIRQPAWLTWVIWILSKIYLIGKDGHTEFPHIPDWFERERSQVRQPLLQTYIASENILS